MWRYVVNDAGKITDIYFLTQLTPDEKLSMVRPRTNTNPGVPVWPTEPGTQGVCPCYLMLL